MDEEQQNLANAREFIKDKLYFCSLSRQPKSYENVHFFTVDNQFVYVNFYADFGPSNISHLVRFCNLLQQKFEDPATANKTICLYSSFEIDRRANAAFLICAYMVLVYKQTPQEAYQALMGQNPPFVPYRDAGYGPATYHLTILDCLNGLHKAMSIGLFDLQNFDLEEYEFYEKVENGDYNWITPKFLALANPKDELPPNFRIPPVRYASSGKPLVSCYQSNNLIKWMLQNNIKTIIRLNNKTYDRKPFLDAGIEHIELYFPDGSTPPDAILKRFLEICESRSGPIAVHCKAGLGRTGTLIASYLMKHYRVTASEVISFMRIIRPGSVVGPQQNFLQALQPRLWKMTPDVPLPVEISCWKPATYPNQLTRFGAAKFASRAPHQEQEMQVEDTVQATEREMKMVHEMYANIQEYENELAKERQNVTLKQLEQFSIPVQPRKHLNADRPKPQISIMQQHQVHHEQQQMNSRYHLRSQSANQAQNLSLRPRQVHGIEADLDMKGVEEYSELEQELNHYKSKQTVKN